MKLSASSIDFVCVYIYIHLFIFIVFKIALCYPGEMFL
jgi:hypothetical protein